MIISGCRRAPIDVASTSNNSRLCAACSSSYTTTDALNPNLEYASAEMAR
jgi:hypothetical protein